MSAGNSMRRKLTMRGPERYPQGQSVGEGKIRNQKGSLSHPAVPLLRQGVVP